MSKKVLDNGNTLITDEKTPKEIANRLDESFDEDKCLVCECDDGTPNEVAERIMNKHVNDSQIKVNETVDNKLDGLNNIEKVNIKDMGNKLNEYRKNKVPKQVDLL